MTADSNNPEPSPFAAAMRRHERRVARQPAYLRWRITPEHLERA
jgi:hypothetical protein